MKQKAKAIIKHPLIYGSFIVVFGGIIANFFNFLFNLFMSRSLSVTDYGTLASIVSMVTFPMLVVAAVNPVIIRFAGDYFAQSDEMLLRGLYKKFFNFLLTVGIIIFILSLLFLSQIGYFFHITNHFVLILAAVTVFISFLNTINLSFLQAKLTFGFQVVVNLTSAILKVVLGIGLVLFGYSVNGAVGAIVVSSIGGYIISFVPLRFLFSKGNTAPPIEVKELFRYGVPSALTLFGLTSFISSDILLVKHFLDAVQAGQYAGLSLVGRIIYFISAPIGSVMFPIIVQKHTKGDKFHNTFKLALLLVLIPSCCLTLFYFLFPQFSILFFLKRPEYLTVAPLIGIFGIYMTCYCVLFLLSNFYLSIKKTRIYIPIIIGAILQIILISLYHQSFLQIIWISFGIILALTIGFLLYYPYATKK